MCVLGWGVGRGVGRGGGGRQEANLFWVERARACESGAQGSNCSLTQTCCAI